MSQKTKWVESGGVLYQVADVQAPEEPTHVLAARDDGEAGPVLVDASQVVPLVQLADGECLGRTRGGPAGRWAIFKLSCGEKGDCGCGCDNNHRAKVLGPEQAAVWLQAKGVPLDQFPGGEELKDAHRSITA